jgi:transposase-like protein
VVWWAPSPVVGPSAASVVLRTFVSKLTRSAGNGHPLARVIVTDKLRSYGVAQRQLLPGVEHRQSRYLNNRAENSHRADTETRAANATVQITRTGPAPSLHSLIHLRSLPSSPTSTCSPCLSLDPVGCF